MKQKTALQELIEWINNGIENFDPVYVIGLETARTHATELLEKEKNIYTKAEKWDKLGEKIAMYYEGENGESPVIQGDLCDIGEDALMAFGWL